MKKSILLFAAILLVISSCKKEDKDKIIENPQPVEQELITTVQLVVTGDGGFNKTFLYKVENGFGSTTQGHVHIDDVELAPNTTYTVAVMVLNEKEDPAEDVTEEVLEERDEHLFVFQSTPATGAGSIAFSNGSKDNNGEPFNQSVSFETGNAGNGTLTVTLKHEPTDKSAATVEAAGGETDAEATFPLIIK